MFSLARCPKIYHITHIDNLDNILRTRKLLSDAKCIERGMDCEIVGMSTIKKRRLEECVVTCHPGTKVGEYVPFYFCPRSIMLYILHKGNHRDIDYRGGQKPILHLQADLRTVVQWAENKNKKWALSDRNAGAYLAQFYKNIDDLDKINWSAVKATDFRNMLIKESKQAEFLIYESFPLELIEKIGVCNNHIRNQVLQKLGSVSIPASIERDWYYKS